MKINKINLATSLLYVACACVLLGRAYQHLFFEAPYRAFFLDENYFAWAVAWFSEQSWFEYVTSIETAEGISFFGKTVGIILLLAALSLPVLNQRLGKIGIILLISSTVLMAFMAFCYYLDKGFHAAQLMEYTAQVFTPALLVMLVRKNFLQLFPWLLRLVIAFTFVGHGLYALGLYPIPGHFVHMIISNLHVTNEQAVTILYIAGILDLVLAFAIFSPHVDRYFLAYAAFWGFVTALARLTTYVSFDHMFGLTLHQMGFEFIIRTPHFLLPIIAILLKNKQNKLALRQNT